MLVPKTEKEVRGFLGRLQYISRFIARLTDICEPIFHLLRISLQSRMMIVSMLSKELRSIS